MNPLTNVKNIQKLSEQELKRNFKTSWHDQYKDSAWVFIGGLPYDLSEGDIICVFSQYGEVVNLNLVRDKGSGKSKGFCFLCYEDQRSTVLAVDNFNGMKILGRTIRVDHVNDYKPPKESKSIDDVTKMLYETGCAPGASVLTVNTERKNEEKPDSKEGILKKVKKEKRKPAKKEKKSAKKKSSKKKKKRNKEVRASSSSSSESSSESSSSEEGEESDQGGSKSREKRKEVCNQRDPKEKRGDPEEQVKVKVEEEEEEKRRVRREQRKSPGRECYRAHEGNQWNGTRSEEAHNSRSADGDAGAGGRWGQDSDRRRPDKVDMDTNRRSADKRREDERRGKDSSSSKDERRQGKEGEGGGADRRLWRDKRDERDQPSRWEDGKTRKERHEKDDKWETTGSSSRRKGERFEDGYEKGKREERRWHNERSRSPCERESNRLKR